MQGCCMYLPNRSAEAVWLRVRRQHDCERTLHAPAAQPDRERAGCGLRAAVGHHLQCAYMRAIAGLRLSNLSKLRRVC